MPKRYMRLPVVSEGAEYLVMGHLMRRNIMTFKAPPYNEGYDLICRHPDPRHERQNGEREQVLVQVKSRFNSKAGGFLVREETLNAFDFLVVAYMNLGDFGTGKDGSAGARDPEFFTFPAAVAREKAAAHGKWGHGCKVVMKRADAQYDPYRGDVGFELIAQALGVERPKKVVDE
jgi:hypothetical protein